jgi:lipase
VPDAVVDARRVAWREAGAGEPALLLHCALAHSGAFAGVMDRLADRLAMRALDQPGHGLTERDPGRGEQAQAADNARALLVETGPAHLVGHSFGGTVALRLAIEDPDLVRSLTLIEPVLFGLMADAGLRAYAEEVAAQQPFHRAAAAGDWNAAGRAFLGRWGAEPLDRLPARQAEYIRARLPLIVASEPELFDHPARRVRLSDLPAVACPVLLVEGADSPPAVAAILDVIAGAIPRARRVVVPGAGHMLPITHPEAVSGALRDFLGGDRRE